MCNINLASSERLSSSLHNTRPSGTAGEGFVSYFENMVCHSLYSFNSEMIYATNFTYSFQLENLLYYITFHTA